MIPPNLPPFLEPSVRRILKPKRTINPEEVVEDIEEKVNRLILEGDFLQAFNTIASIPEESARTHLTHQVTYKFLEKDQFELANKLIGLMNPKRHYLSIYAAAFSCCLFNKLGPALAYFRAMPAGEGKRNIFEEILSRCEDKNQLLALTLQELVSENKIEEAIEIALLCPVPENELFDIGKHLHQSNKREKIPLILDKMSTRKQELLALVSTAS